MIAAAVHPGQLVIYVTDDLVGESAVATVKESIPGALVLADLLEPLYDPSVPTRQASHILGRLKAELAAMVQSGERVAVICRRHSEDLGTRAHFLSSFCTMADRVHVLKST
jgi:hypothetical protein